MKKIDYIQVTDIISLENFEAIKNFILKKGDRMTYCNMFNHNPHYKFSNFDIYLTPDIGQKNINCEPTLSDFNELVIQNFNDEESAYYYISLIRAGDKKRPELYIHDSCLENNTYLHISSLKHSYSLADSKTKLLNHYLKELFLKIHNQNYCFSETNFDIVRTYIKEQIENSNNNFYIVPPINKSNDYHFWIEDDATILVKTNKNYTLAIIDKEKGINSLAIFNYNNKNIVKKCHELFCKILVEAMPH